MNARMLVLGWLVAATVQAAPVPTIFEGTYLEGEESLSLGQVFYFFHDGSFDPFDAGQPASEAIRRLAQTARGGALRDQLLAAQPDALANGIVHPVSFIENPDLEDFHVQVQSLDPQRHRYLSVFAKVSPSDDAFIGNDDPRQYEVFDDQGAFLGPLVIDVQGSAVWDAGSKLNDEIEVPPLDRPWFDDAEWDAGVSTSEPIHRHPGFNGSLGNPQGGPRRILGSQPLYRTTRIDAAAADFTRPGMRLSRFRLSAGLSDYFSGAWYTPETQGEGFLIHVHDAATPSLSVAWFTFRNDGSGRPLWLVGSGPINGYISAEVELYEAEGGRFASTDNPNTVRTTYWGKAVVGFGLCDQGRAYVFPASPDYPQVVMPLQRLTSPAAGSQRKCGPYSLGGFAGPAYPYW